MWLGEASGLWAFHLYVQLEATRFRSWPQARSSRRFYHTFRDSQGHLPGGGIWVNHELTHSLWWRLFMPLSLQMMALSLFPLRQDYPFVWSTCLVSAWASHAWNALSFPLKSLLPQWPLYLTKRLFNPPHCCFPKWFLLWLALLNGLSLLMGAIKTCCFLYWIKTVLFYLPLFYFFLSLH